MEIILSQYELWEFMYDFILKIALFVFMPLLLSLIWMQKKKNKKILIGVLIYILLALMVIINDHAIDFNYIQDVRNSDIVVEVHEIGNIKSNGPARFYYFFEESRFSLPNWNGEKNNINVEGYKCQVEYYSTSKRIIKFKVLD